MRLLDDHGRLFGRLNIIDAAALAVCGLLIPLAFGAYLLFAEPPPTLTAVVPATVTASEASADLTILGVHLRPYLRVDVGPVTARFLFENAAQSTIQLPTLAPGVYDVVLYDESQEVSRLSKALTVARRLPPLPAPPLRGPRFTVAREERLLIDGVGIVLTVLRDRVAETCAVYRSYSDERQQTRLEALGAVPCDPIPDRTLGQDLKR